jgi:pimeloyl-ACP methyl ester carboxylesterase
MNEQKKKVHIGDIDVAYKIFGNDISSNENGCILFIMGYRLTMDVWSPLLLENLASKYKVIVFDNRGSGETSAGKKEFSMDQFTEDTVGLLDSLKIEKTHVLGWSMGTNIALNLAINYPNRVNKLVLDGADCGGKEVILPNSEVIQTLIDTSATAEEQGTKFLRLVFPDKWFKEYSSDWHNNNCFTKSIESSKTENVERQTKAMLGWEGVCNKLSQIRQQPTLLITGTEDVITPPANSWMIAQRIPGAWLVQIREAGHGAMYQYPEKLSRIIMTFLETS